MACRRCEQLGEFLSEMDSQIDLLWHRLRLLESRASVERPERVAEATRPVNRSLRSGTAAARP
jgi:hypothetical protein